MAAWLSTSVPSQSKMTSFMGGLMHRARPTAQVEQDRFGLDHVASIATSRPKRDSCPIHGLESKIHVP
jgi:hypothetical protein